MMKIKERIWKIMLNRTPKLLLLYYKVVGREGSDEMKMVRNRLIGKNVEVNSNDEDVKQESNISAVNQGMVTKTGDTRLPYLNGAESSIIVNRMIGDPHHLVKRLKQYQVISFDIFDTLLFRPFLTPADMFILVGERLHINDFRNIRVRAEQRAREIAFAITGNREVTLQDIYDQIERETGISAKIGMQIELDIEEKYCFANPYIKIVYEMLKGLQKRIIITSDMYLSEAQLVRLLNKNGFDGFERLFVSCECGCGKGGNGNLFKVIQNVYGENVKICHIGDNYRNDVLNARENGLDAIHFPNVNDVGSKYRASRAGMSELIGSTYGALVNIKLHGCLNKYSEAFEYGYIYGGLYVFGYCNWIHDYVKANNIDKVLFLSRDGDIYRRVYNLLFDDTDNEYVYWSRYPSIICTAEYDRREFLIRFIRHRLNDVYPMTIEMVLKNAKIDFLLDKLPQYHLKPDAIIQKEFIGRLENMVIDNWDRIIESFKIQKMNTEAYLRGVIGEAKHVAIVDVGWLGSGPLAIKRLLEESLSECKVDCLCAASYTIPANANIATLMTKSVKCYIFNDFYNRNLKDYHLNTNKYCNNVFFELFTQATSPSLEEICESDGKVFTKFGLAEVENYNVLREMHLGIVEFAIDYKKHFGDEPWLCDISGYDAYIPFRFVSQNVSIIRRIFRDYVISRNIGYDSNRNEMETLSSILKMRGL